MESPTLASMSPEPSVGPDSSRVSFLTGQKLGNKARVCGLDALHSSRRSEVDVGDVVRLQSGRWLNDRLINYNLWLLATSYYERGFQMSDFIFLQTYVWQNWLNEEYLPDLAKVTRTNPILSNFIAMPCNVEQQHWILLIVAHPKDLVAESPDPDSHPIALYFDSYPGVIRQDLQQLIHLKVQRLLKQLAGRLQAPISKTVEERISGLAACYPQVRRRLAHPPLVLTQMT